MCMVGRKESSAPMWAKLCPKIDLEDPTKVIDQVYLGCTHREATIDEETMRTKTERFQRITTSNVEETPNTKTVHKAKMVSSWRYDSRQNHTDQCGKRYCELAQTCVSQLKQVATPCTHDHQLKTC